MTVNMRYRLKELLVYEEEKNVYLTEISIGKWNYG
jgi:hypothetical protein